MSNAIALAGLLLVFSGALLAKGASFDPKFGRKYKYLGRLVLIPVLACFALAWMSVNAIQGGPWSGYHLITGLKITLGLAIVFAIIAMWGSS
jgi:hypothetical protein